MKSFSVSRDTKSQFVYMPLHVFTRPSFTRRKLFTIWCWYQTSKRRPCLQCESSPVFAQKFPIDLNAIHIDDSDNVFHLYKTNLLLWGACIYTSMIAWQLDRCHLKQVNLSVDYFITKRICIIYNFISFISRTQTCLHKHAEVDNAGKETNIYV